MAETTTLIGTAFFGRKVGLPDYSNVEAGIHVQFELDPNDETASAKNAANAFAAAKIAVFSQLENYGVLFEVKQDGSIAEQLAVAAVTQAFTTPSGEVPTVVAAPPAAANVPTTEKTDNCQKCGGTKWWDNRPKKASGQYSAKAPDFKCANKECGAGVWDK